MKCAILRLFARTELGASKLPSQSPQRFSNIGKHIVHIIKATNTKTQAEKVWEQKTCAKCIPKRKHGKAGKWNVCTGSKRVTLYVFAVLFFRSLL